MLHIRAILTSLCVLCALAASESRAQPDFDRTVIVDPTADTSTGFANYNTIQEAIDDGVDDDPTVRWTVLIYAGVYEEEVTLGDRRENVDLVGVDRDAVIIRPDPSQGDNAGIIIDGPGVRNNSIRNLTIEIPDKTGTGDDLDGILIKRTLSGTDPSGITIEDVTILVEADASRAIRADVPVSDITITGVTITTTEDDSYGIHLDGGSASSPNADIVVTGLTLVSEGDDAHGIYLEHETDRFILRDSSLTLSGHLAVPFNVSSSLGADTIEDLTLTRVTIRHTNQVAAGVQGQPTTGMSIDGCDFFMQDAHTVQAGNNTRIANSSIITRDISGIGGTDNAGVVANGKSGLRIENSVVEGRLAGVQLKGDCTDVRIAGSELRGSHYGFFSRCGDDIEVFACTISGDSSRGNEGGLQHTPYQGVYIDDDTGCEPGVIRFVSCEIDGLSTERLHDAMGVYVEAAPVSADGPVTFESCTITAHQEAASGTDTAQCFGVKADEADSIALIGGSISSSDGDERETDQYDLRSPTADGSPTIFVSGTALSKWYGRIGAAIAPVPTVQRTISVPAASNAAVNGPTTLTGSEQEITSFITNPQGYRVLRLTLSQVQAPAADYTALLIGTNAAGEQITDAITVLSSQTAGEGAKPFLTVTTIILPAGSGTASIGTTDRLGLEFPIASTSAVQQQGKMASAGTGYTIGAPGTVDASHSTVDVSTLTTGDSLEWAARASK